MTSRPERYRIEQSSLYFVLGELPFLTELYERRRSTVHSDRHLTIDGIKELLLETRTRSQAVPEVDGQTAPTWVTPQLLQLYLQYVRNLALLDRRLTPDLYQLVLAAKQMAGDDFAISLLETAKSYAYQNSGQTHLPQISAGLGQFALPDEQIVRATNRFQGMPLVWRSLSLDPVHRVGEPSMVLSLEPHSAMLLAAGRFEDRKFPHARPRAGEGDHRIGFGEE